VCLAKDLCPEICGNPCLDPFLSEAIIRSAVKNNKKPHQAKMLPRLKDYWWHEITHEMRMKPNPIADLEGFIPLQWRPCYSMHRQQRIRKGDPFLSLMENFCLRLAMCARDKEIRFLKTDVIRDQEGLQPLDPDRDSRAESLEDLETDSLTCISQAFPRPNALTRSFDRMDEAERLTNVYIIMTTIGFELDVIDNEVLQEFNRILTSR
jgi:hypothetical protein